MTLKILPLSAATIAVALIAGCSSESARNFNATAGDQIDSGIFGRSTTNNELVATGRVNAAIQLSRRFAEEAPTTVNFAFNSAQLDSSARAALDAQAAWIARYPSARFKVYGHTDKVGGNSFNKRLGQRRANAVVHYLVSRGISRNRLEAVVSFGETQPLIVSEGRERRNRRTVTEVAGFLGKRPQRQDGKYALFSYTETVTSATEPHEVVIIDEGGDAEER